MPQFSVSAITPQPAARRCVSHLIGQSTALNNAPDMTKCSADEKLNAELAQVVVEVFVHSTSPALGS
mgnify:CR=1 FL=1